jgi:hypothetical protein
MKNLTLLTLILRIIPLASALTCPRGLENDAYPGVCGLYADEDNNQVCDYSEFESIIPSQVLNN